MTIAITTVTTTTIRTNFLNQTFLREPNCPIIQERYRIHAVPMARQQLQQH